MSGRYVAVKEAVLPFNRFFGADSLLGPEMRSTGEVMGIAHDFPTAFAKAQAAAGAALPDGGTVFITVTDTDKAAGAGIAAQLHDLGFEIVATRGHGRGDRSGWACRCARCARSAEGSPHVVDAIASGEVDLVINTPTGSGARSDGWEIRRAAVARGIPCITTLSGGQAAIARDPRGARRRAGGRLAAGGPSPMTAPFGRRARGGAGAPACRALRRARGRRRARAGAAGAVLHARRRRALGRGRGRAAVPRPGAVGHARGRRTGRVEFLLEDVGPGTHRLCELEPGRGSRSSARSAAASPRPPAEARCSSAAGSAIAPLLAVAGALGRRARCSASATREHAQAGALFADR